MTGQPSRAGDQGKALVTGASGFVGGHLVDLLVERGRAVRCLVRSSSKLKYLKHPEVELVYGGLDGSTDWDAALDGVDTVYHVAGLTFARRSQDYFTVNHKGTEAILAQTLKRREGIKRFVLISSLAAVGPGRGKRPVDERTEPGPITPYGRSKLMAEEAVMAVRDLLPITIVRPPAVYGPRDYAIYEMFKSATRGLLPKIGGKDMLVSLVHARDLAEGIILAGESPSSKGRAYFISSEEVYSFSSVADLLGKAVGRRTRTIAIPRAIAFGVAVVAEAAAALIGKPPVINRDKVTDFSQECWGCSIDAAKRDLGYRPKVPLEAGLRETFEWYKQEGWL
jgi:nucleoside-diphosphate-sugar epimerase